MKNLDGFKHDGIISIDGRAERLRAICKTFDPAVQNGDKIDLRRRST